MNGTQLCRMFKKTSAKGGIYLTGRINGTSRLLILPNSKAGQPNEADYNAFFVPIEAREEDAQPQEPKPQGRPQGQAWPAPEPVAQEHEL
jgi:hypothetical protein